MQLALKWLRTKPDGWAVADFGCGDAQIAQELCKTHTVHSFDLYSNNVHVTACNMAKVPCKSGTQLVLITAAYIWHCFSNCISDIHAVYSCPLIR